MDAKPFKPTTCKGRFVAECLTPRYQIIKEDDVRVHRGDLYPGIHEVVQPDDIRVIFGKKLVGELVPLFLEGEINLPAKRKPVPRTDDPERYKTLDANHPMVLTGRANPGLHEILHKDDIRVFLGMAISEQLVPVSKAFYS